MRNTIEESHLSSIDDQGLQSNTKNRQLASTLFTEKGQEKENNNFNMAAKKYYVSREPS